MDGSLNNDGVLEEHIPWETYKTTGQISDRDFALIKRFDKSTETAKAAALEEARFPHFFSNTTFSRLLCIYVCWSLVDVDVAYCCSPLQSTAAVFEALFTVLRNVSHEATVRYTLALVDEILTLDPAREEELHTPSPKHPSAPPPNRALVLSRLLSRDDWFTQAKAAKLLSRALKASQSTDNVIVSQFLEWLSGQLRQPSHGEESILVASGALSGLLRSRQVRSVYARNIPLLVRTLPHLRLRTHHLPSHPTPRVLPSLLLTASMKTPHG
jgi:hypothetical protein